MVKFYMNETAVEQVRFPITELGTTSKITMTIENDSEDDIELIPYTEDSDVTIIDYPKRLTPRATSKSTWEFTPSRERIIKHQQEGTQAALNAECGFKILIG